MKTEQRKFKRLKVKDSAFAVFRPEFRKLGKIKNISGGGLACEYLIHKGVESDLLELEIDILLTNGKFYLSMIPCKVVYDIKKTNKSSAFMHNGLECRLCGLKFQKLISEKKSNLNYFLKNHVV